MQAALADRPQVNSELGRVLLVEDNPGDALLVRTMFEEQNATTVGLEVVERLSEACSRLEAGDVDLVLLDLMLPDSQSYRESIARLREKSDTPIVVLTGHGDTSLGLECILWGAEDFLAKDDLDPMLLLRTALHSVRRHSVTAARLRDIVSRFEDGSARHEAISNANEPILTVNEIGRVVFINDAGCRFLGASFESIVGASLLDHLENRAKDRRRRAVQMERIGDVVWDGQACHIILLSGS